MILTSKHLHFQKIDEKLMIKKSKKNYLWYLKDDFKVQMTPETRMQSKSITPLKILLFHYYIYKSLHSTTN